MRKKKAKTVTSIKEPRLKKRKPVAAIPDEELAIPKVALPVAAVDGHSGAGFKQALREFVAQVNEGAGRNLIISASNFVNTFRLRRPCGIMQLDIATAGGLPAGGLSEISGPENSGKTYLLYSYMRMHQLIYGNDAAIACACVEPFEPERALQVGLRLGLDRNRDIELLLQWNHERTCRGEPPFTEEQLDVLCEKVGEFHLIRGDTGEELLETVLNCVRSNLYGIVAVDPVSAILPMADADKTLEDPNKMAARASLITNFITKYTPIINGLNGPNYTTLIFISQVRSNQERAMAPSHMQKYIKQWASVGAWSERHAKLIDVTVWSGEKIRKTIKGVDHIIGKNIKFEITKGKAGTHDNITGEYPFHYKEFRPEGIDRVETVIMLGLQFGVIVEHNGLITVIRPEDGTPSEITGIPGLQNFKRMMEIDIEFEMAVRRYVLAAKGIRCLYR